jgi:endonuclease III
MDKSASHLPEVLLQLEAHYGLQAPCWPTDPYQFLVWWHCGYPASDAACAKGWAALSREIGIEPAQILAAGAARLAHALKPGGMVPELRAMRLMEIATRIQNEYSGDLRASLSGPLTKVRQALRQFPNIGDPGVDRILLFAGMAPIPAVPSNCPHVLVRIQHGREREEYGVNYRLAQQAIETETPATLDARTRAYLLLKCHGQSLCKRTNPKCGQCPVNSGCTFHVRAQRAQSASA